MIIRYFFVTVYLVGCAGSDPIWEREGWSQYRLNVNKEGLIEHLPLSDCLARIQVVDKYGHLAVYPGFEEAKEFSEGLAAGRKDGKWGYINTIGWSIGYFDYDAVKDFINGLGAVKKTVIGV